MEAARATVALAGTDPLKARQLHRGALEAPRRAPVDSSDLGALTLPRAARGVRMQTRARDDERLLENAVMLGSGASNVRVLEYVEFLHDGFGLSFDVSPDVQAFLNGYATSIGRSVTFAQLTDYHQLRSALGSADVLLVYDQLCATSPCGGGPGALPSVATEWNPILKSFLGSGGVVIVLSGNQGPSSGTSSQSVSWAQTFLLASGPGLFNLPGYAPNTGRPEVVAPNDAVVLGVASNYPATKNSYLTFHGAIGGTLVVRDDTSFEPIVLHQVYPGTGAPFDAGAPSGSGGSGGLGGAGTDAGGDATGGSSTGGSAAGDAGTCPEGTTLWTYVPRPPNAACRACAAQACCAEMKACLQDPNCPGAITNKGILNGTEVALDMCVRGCGCLI
jgi:hypothetical protein